RRKPGRQREGLEPRLLDVDMGLAVLEVDRRREPGRELVVHVRADVDLRLAEGQPFGYGFRLAAEREALDRVVLRVLAVAPRAALEDHADGGIERRIAHAALRAGKRRS